MFCHNQKCHNCIWSADLTIATDPSDPSTPHDYMKGVQTEAILCLKSLQCCMPQVRNRCGWLDESDVYSEASLIMRWLPHCLEKISSDTMKSNNLDSYNNFVWKTHLEITWSNCYEQTNLNVSGSFSILNRIHLKSIWLMSISNKKDSVFFLTKLSKAWPPIL